ncbi:hypothetical protein AGABI1DRAFT_85757 [Agaricus bisporus var. burnettii JB137-S8]|uniref:Uncharacterized protein n=1 Tax=Agaricus bisporus var. burnettii (strain JB137-S8 / ATCC MYA-4627 / FGSC 10392) TaxID=597362 RepID=K5X7B9_AGABU|nr:uncharacterized protein AGABI1DRAFT_85757 [Agaricus bisporus var. burnettii JB137-S8]EKM78872.1 hypothetical protein AGABI1DRAFT_85757 [Agaricus bisporus var. burnettii JB137-S8]
MGARMVTHYLARPLPRPRQEVAPRLECLKNRATAHQHKICIVEPARGFVYPYSTTIFTVERAAFASKFCWTQFCWTR